MASESIPNDQKEGPEPTNLPRTTEEKLQWLRNGKSLHFPASLGQDHTDAEGPRIIPASILKELIKNPDRTCTVPINISNAIIVGPLELYYSTFLYDFSIKNSVFTDKLDFSFATFKRSAIFTGSQFHGASQFRAAHAEYDFNIRLTRFADDASFMDLRVNEVLWAEGARFGKVGFERMNVAKSAFFRPIVWEGKLKRLRFCGEADFRDAHIEGNAIFEAADFRKNANFNRMRIGGAAFFKPYTAADYTRVTSFAGEANFSGAQIENDAIFDGARFKKKTNFSLVKIKGDVSFLPARVHEGFVPVRFGGEVNFRGAQINGSVNFDGSQFRRKANFERIQIGGVSLFRAFVRNQEVIPTKFRRKVSYQAAVFNVAADFNGVQFLKEMNFRFVRIEGDAYFRAIYQNRKETLSCFGGKADFSGADIKGSAQFDSAWFKSDANFESVKIGGKARFRTATGRKYASPIRFDGMTRFVHVHILGSAEFHGAQFRKEVNFGRAQIDGSAFFDPSASFYGPTSVSFAGGVRFVDAYVKGTASFLGAQFLEGAIFDRLTIGGDAFFSTDANRNSPKVINFNGPTRFVQMHIQGTANFNGAQFKHGVNFNGIQIDSSAIFSPATYDRNIIQTYFAGGVRFQNARIRGLTDFGGANFREGVIFEGVKIDSTALFRTYPVKGKPGIPIVFHGQASFLDAHIQGSAEFNGAQFNSGANFSRANIEGNVFFNKAGVPAKFSGRSSFVGAHFSNQVEFKDAVFQGQMDLRGFTYERIKVDYNQLLDSLAALEPYDRQPYVQLEKVYRAVGQDRLADDVYLARRHRERKKYSARVHERKGVKKISSWEALQDLGRVLGDSVQWGLWNYGVRPYMLLFASVAVILIGSYIFTFRGAVIHKDPKLRTTQEEQLSQPLASAFNVSLHQFIPIIEIPPGDEWKPSDKPAPMLGSINISFAGYATLHRLLGAILVPLGVAGLSGLLIRREKS